MSQASREEILRIMEQRKALGLTTLVRLLLEAQVNSVVKSKTRQKMLVFWAMCLKDLFPAH